MLVTQRHIKCSRADALFEFPRACTLMCCSSQRLRLSPQQAAGYTNMASQKWRVQSCDVSSKWAIGYCTRNHLCSLQLGVTYSIHSVIITFPLDILLVTLVSNLVITGNSINSSFDLINILYFFLRAHKLLGQVYQKLGDKEKAIAAFNRFIHLIVSACTNY